MVLGPSGSGKSRLSAALIAHGAWLIADDQTAVTVEQGCLVARCPRSILGRRECRGVGIVRAPAQDSAPVRLVLDADRLTFGAQGLPRFPEFKPWRIPQPGALAGSRPVPCVPFDALRPDAALAVIAALARAMEWEDSPAP
jgi:hypothetical protein